MPHADFNLHGSTTFQVLWILGCRVQCASSGSDWRQVYTGSNTSQKIADLAPGHAYIFRVAACNGVGCGPWGVAASVTTLLRPPQPPASITLDVDASCLDRSAHHRPHPQRTCPSMPCSGCCATSSICCLLGQQLPSAQLPSQMRLSSWIHLQGHAFHTR